MARQLGVGLLTKLARNGRLTNLVSPSPFLKPNSTPFHQAEYATLSRSHLWRICTPNPNGVRATIQNGVFPTSLLARRVFSNALLQARTKFPVMLRNTRSVHSFNSLDRGRRSIFRRFTTDGVVLGLIVTNVAIFMLWQVADTQFMVKNFMIGHCFGPQFLLKLYLGGAITGSIFYLVYQAFVAPSLQGKLQGVTDPGFPSLGASGAVNAIMLLDIFLFPTKTIMLDFIIPVPAALLGAFMIGRDIWRVLQGDSRVSGSAHLGGATVAVLAWLRYRKGRFGRF